MMQGNFRTAFLMLAASLPLAYSANAIASDVDSQLSLTVYNSDLALIEHVRALDCCRRAVRDRPGACTG